MSKEVTMPTSDEKKVLMIIEANGGECAQARVARKMGIRSDYVRVILNSMGMRDYIDVLRSGKVRLAEKGWRALGKEPPGDPFRDMQGWY